LILFGIRHKSSKLLMPLKRHGKGHTHIEVEDFKLYNKQPPRLFRTEIGARRALAAWLKGPWVNHEIKGGLFEDKYEQYAEPPDKPPENRSAREMEVVKIQLKEMN